MIGVHSVGFACTVCFGDPNSLSSKALTAAVFFLLGVVGFVLAGIAFTAVKWSRRVIPPPVIANAMRAQGNE